MKAVEWKKTAKKSTGAADLDRQNDNRFLEIVVTVSVSVLLVLLALTLKPTLLGDGMYYYAMLDGLANHGSPAITDQVRESIAARFSADPGTGLTIPGRDGKLYALHFFAYPLFCVPAYKLLQAFNLDVVAAFQLANALLIAIALAYVLVISRLAAPARWTISAGFLLSTATIYFQWSHPEVFAAALVLMASVSLVTRQYTFAALMAAIGSLQNPSVALLILPIVGAQIWELRVEKRIGWLTREMFAPIVATAAVSMLGLASYGWSYFQFGVANPIATKGFIDYSSINFGRLYSFIFDLNQGLIVGLPLLLWAVPAALVFRANSLFNRDSPILRREDLLLVGFLLMVVPTLGQVNWNGGHSVFLRYAAWAGMAPLVWAAAAFTGIVSGRRILGTIPAVAIQLAMALYIGGIAVNRTPNYVQFMPWVEPIWNLNPRIYDPVPEIFFESVVGAERAINTPAFFKADNGQMVRVLTRKVRIEDVEEEVCGRGGAFTPFDDRPSSTPKLSKSELGYQYVTGRFSCGVAIPSVFSATGTSSVPQTIGLGTGWSRPESWGVWTDGSMANLTISSPSVGPGGVVLKLVGQAYVNERHPQQRIEVVIGDRVVDSWVTRLPDEGFERAVQIGGDELTRSGGLRVEFRLPDAMSPAELGLAGDGRRLGLGLKEIRLERVAAEPRE